MMKRILIVCPDSKHFIQEYIKNVFTDKSQDIIFISMNADLEDRTWKENGVTVYNLKNRVDENKYRTILMAPFRLLSLRKKIGKVDVIHYHYIDSRFTRLVDFFIRRRDERVLLTFWGSDLLKASNRVIQKFSRLFKLAYKIVVMSAEMKEVLEKNTDGLFNDKTIVLDFGNSTIEMIKATDRPGVKEIIKRDYGIPTDRIIVHMGYNGSQAQQHIKLAKALETLDTSLKEQLFIVVPFGYGCLNEGYKRAVSDALNTVGIDYRIDTEYLNQEEVVLYRLTADVFLYGQETDAISSSVIEYLCAGAYVIKPKWLDYSLFITHGVKMEEYDTFEDLSFALGNVLMDDRVNSVNYDLNKEVVLQIKSWKNIKEKWLKLYS